MGIKKQKKTGKILRRKELIWSSTLPFQPPGIKELKSVKSGTKLKLFSLESSDYCQTDLRYAYEDGVSNVPTLLKLYSDLTLLSDESFNSDFSLFERQVFTVIVT